MKPTTGLIALAFQTAGVLSRATAETEARAQVCGSLGVMSVPEGADPDLYRNCESHPLGADRYQYADQSLAPTDQKRGDNVGNVKAADIFGRAAQACYFDAPYGCSGGYCWKACGNAGEWCWTAGGDGSGDWLQCKSYDDCNTNSACGKGCKSGDKACGCSC